MCNINKNRLLALYFHEGTEREEKKIRGHVEQCSECRDYLLQLEETTHLLNSVTEVKPLDGTLDMIVDTLPLNAPETIQTVEWAKTDILPVKSIISIVGILLFITGSLVFLYFFHDKLDFLPFWDALEKSWAGKYLGSWGMAAILFFLFGTFISMALTPVLILENQSKKYRYYFG